MHLNLKTTTSANPHQLNAIAPLSKIGGMLLCATLMMSTVSCATTPAATQQAQPQRLASGVAPARIYTAQPEDIEEARLIFAALIDGATHYFHAEQKRSTLDGEEPWHLSSDKFPVGLPVPWTEYAFPGGEGFWMNSHAEVPRSGMMQEAKPTSNGPLQAALDKLNFAWPNTPTRFRYSYEIDGLGEEIRLSLKAEADFNPAVPGHFTITQNLSYNKNEQALEASELEVRPEDEAPKI